MDFLMMYALFSFVTNMDGLFTQHTHANQVNGQEIACTRPAMTEAQPTHIKHLIEQRDWCLQDTFTSTDGTVLSCGFIGARYPPLAKRRGYKGTVIVGVLIDVNGVLVDAWVEEPSAHRILNNSAKRAMHDVTFLPPAINHLDENGMMTKFISVTF